MYQFISSKYSSSNPNIHDVQSFKINDFRKNSQHNIIHNNALIYNQTSIKQLVKRDSQLGNMISESPIKFKNLIQNTSKIQQKSPNNKLNTKCKPILKNITKAKGSFIEDRTNFSSHYTKPSSDYIQSANSQPFSPYSIKKNHHIERMKSNNQKGPQRQQKQLEKPFSSIISPIKVKMDDFLRLKSQILNEQIIKKNSQQFHTNHQNIKIRKNSQKTSEHQLLLILNPEHKNKMSFKQKIHNPHSNTCFINQNNHKLKESSPDSNLIQKKLIRSTLNLQQKSFDESFTDLNKTLNTSIQKKISKTDRKKSNLIINSQQVVTESKIIGNGRFGEVYMARHKKTNFLVAIKKICKEKIKQFKMQKQIIQEITLQYSLRHPNIVNLYGFCCDQSFIYMILQYIPQGTLFNELQIKERYNQHQVVMILKSIVSAIKYLHDRQIAHRDIKPQNILLSNKVFKLCDFGWAGRIITPRKTYCGTLDYAPPQILEKKQYGLSVDMWCLGILIFELLTGKVPFEHRERIQSIKKIINVDKQKIIYPNNISKNSIDLIQSLLKKNPQQRLKITQVLNHQFFK